MKVEVKNYRAINKGSLLGSFTFLLYIDVSGYTLVLTISDCAHFSKDGREWFNFPQKEIKKEGQPTKYFPLIKILQGELLDKLNKLTFEQLKVQDASSTNSNSKNKVQAEAPFDFGEVLF